MAIVYPAAIDSFSVPTLPQSTSLSAAGTSTRDHTQSHQDLGAAVVALETNTAPLDHDHSTTDGDGIWPTSQLLQANTHQSPDTDAAVTSLHHTIGPTPTQAAAGNHAHDYNGSSIFDQPVRICTSTTRPVDPPQGMTIYETDTHCFRCYDEFNPANEIQAGIQGTDTFNRTSNTNLNTTLWSQTYPTGTSPTDGVMATPAGDAASWIVGANVTCRCIARRVNSADAITDTDDQVLDVWFGTQSLELNLGYSSPTNDGYLRMSTDGNTYVRFMVDEHSVQVFYTSTGPSGEALLGSAGKVSTLGTLIHWTFKAIGSTFIIYQGEVQIAAIADNTNATTIGASYRGWGIGMTAAASLHAQAIPAALSEVQIADQPFYTGGLIWQLLPTGAKPHLRAEAHFRQVVVAGAPGGITGFDTILEDWFFHPFMDVDESQTDITIQESGHYDVHAAICWDPGFFGFDHSMISITVNGLDIGRKNWEFVRGNGFEPGFSQTNEISFVYYFSAGDVLRVNARHNASSSVWLWFFDTSPDRQMCWVEVSFRGV